MASTTVRISDTARETLRKLAESSREPMQYILDQAIEEYRRACFLREANEAYGSLRRDEAAWPAPVWGRSPPEPYTEAERAGLISRLPIV